MKTKFTSDGKKVAIIGKLNETEWIVQEIFITKDGDEIPSGEKFTTKSLHDTPRESYKEYRNKELDALIEKKKACVDEIYKEIQMASNDFAAIKDMLKSSKKMAEMFSDDKLDRMAAFISGDFKYFAADHYGVERPIPVNEKIKDEDHWYGNVRYDGIKLLTLFGTSEGDLEFRINTYKDGSGGYATVIPCRTWEEAVEETKRMAVERIRSNKFSRKEFDMCEEIGIKFPKKDRDRFLSREKKNKREEVAALKKKMKEIQGKIKEIEK